MRVLHRKYKEQLLYEALGYLYTPNLIKIKNYLCFDDDEDGNALKIPTADKIIKEWKKHERHVTDHVTEGHTRDT